MGVAAPPQRRPTSQAGTSSGTMMGIDIPQSTGGIEETLDQWNRNPLLCWLCDELYEEPRILSCYHDFCSRCLTPRAVDGKIFCPLCGKVTSLKEGHLPPRDNLMTFLVESSCEERPPCANCEKSNQGMFFCNTCGQALCGHCREETHRARMFSLHDIIHVSKRGREVNKKCAIHGEPYIMFSTTKRAMLCINCFRESSVDDRLHCIDLDAAYGQGCKKLDRAVISIRELQNSVRDGVILFKALLDELRKNTDSERHSINSLVDNLQETIRRAQDHLLREVDGQYETKDKLFRSQLSSLGALLPIIQVHLLMCTTFSSSASKYEFLDLVFQLMERLAAIAHLSHPLRPGQSSQIRTNFKSEFSRALEPHLSVSSKRRGDSTTTVPSGSSLCSEKPGGAHASTESCSRPTSAASVMALGTPYSRRSLSAAKLKILESGGPFADHCKGHEGKFRELTAKFTRLKEEAQELHRDVTLRRCLTRRGRVEEIVRECAGLEEEFRSYGDEMEELRTIFDSAWDEQIQRIYAEQEIFQTQVNDVASLRDENKRLMIIAQQLEPYIRSITALMERISPKLQVPQSQVLSQSGMDVQDNQHMSSVMQQILEQITSCAQDQSRVESRGCADGSSRGPVHLDDSLMMSGIPKPPDPPHTRRTPDHDEEIDNEQQSHGFSQRLVSARLEGMSSSRGDPRGVLSPSSSLLSTVGGSMIMMERGSRSRGRRKRQNSEGDSLVWKDVDLPRILQRRGSEGSEIDSRKGGVLAQLLERVQRRPKDRKSSTRESESDIEDCLSLSRERAQRSRRRGTIDKSEAAERFIDRAAASFDASAIPERPKSACESTLLRAAEKLYNAAAAARPGSHQERRSTERLPESRGARSRDSSGGRTRSAERERDREGGIRVPKSVPPPRVPSGGRGELSMAEVRAIVHADASGMRQMRQETGFSATMPHKLCGRKENIYENVPFAQESRTMQRESRQRPMFRKQSSLDAIPSDSKGRIGYRKSEALVASAFGATPGGESRRGTPLRKADSFEGHEEAVRTLVAAVQENRILRRKKTK